MPAALILALAGFVLVNLFLSALLLWLCCKLFRVCREVPTGPDKPPVVASVSYRRALVLTLLVGVVSWPVLALLVSLGVRLLDSEPSFRSAVIQAAAILPLHLLILRFGLPTSWRKSAGVWLTWTPLRLGQVALAVFLAHLSLFETFIIPTGSMAETLLGYHKQITCPHCGLTFAVNASGEAELIDSGFRVSGCVCPGCREEVSLARPAPRSATRASSPTLASAAATASSSARAF